MNYEQPRKVEDPKDCFFYHHTGLTDLDAYKSDWDLRDCVDEYLGELDFKNQRVLDVGTASGYLTFEMEKRGADVVSFDMPSAGNWDLVPHFQLEAGKERELNGRLRDHGRLQNAYWYLHQKLDSKAKVHYGNIYELPVDLGNFDIVFMGMILGHLRDPFQAIYSASRLCTNKIVITNQVAPKPKWRRKKKTSSSAVFMPSRDRVVGSAWWALSIECIESMLGTIGFQVVDQVESDPACLVQNRLGTERCVSIVAERFAGEAVGVKSVRAAA